MSKRPSKRQRARRSAYIKQKKIARPAWAYGEHSPAPIYRESKRLRNLGRDVNVDHIVPLFNPLVCGLHTRDNLQIVHRLENAKKSNFFWPDAPYSQERLEGLMVTWHQLGLL